MKNIKNFQKQGGWTMWTLLVSLGLLVFFGYIIMKLVPAYSENASIKNAMEIAFENSGNPRTMNKNTYIRAFRKQLYVDLVDDRFLDFKNDVSFKRNKNGVTVGVDYEKVLPLFYNINLMLDFSESINEKF